MMVEEDSHAKTQSAQRKTGLGQWNWARWFIPLGGLLALIGYFGPWVNHRAAGLVVTGLDLGEYVKFLPAVRGGQLVLWREGFYWPLVAVSLAFSLYAFRKPLRYPWPLRALLLALAIVAALNLLPPAWTPGLLTTPEFQMQTAALVICLLAAGFSPFLALIPQPLTKIIVIGLSIGALWFPISSFLRVLPLISALYNQPLQPGWGMFGLGLGLLILIGATLRSSLD